MAHQRVSGVLWWRMELSHYKAIFRRDNIAGYTKDFLQCPQQLGYEVIPALFGGRALDRGEQYPPITYVWPGGTFDGKIYRTTDRVEVGQWTTGAPHPWLVGDPKTDPLITFEGDPDAAIPDDATAQWHDHLEPQGPWLVMVQLEGRQDELHLRAYLEDAPDYLVDASVDHLPPDLWAQMQAHPKSGIVLTPQDGATTVRAERIVNQIRDALSEEPNVLLVGPPGTGKTIALEDLERGFLLQSGLLFDPDEFRNPWLDGGISGNRVVKSLVFHPSYTYEDFVAGLVPGSDPTSGTLVLNTRTGPLLSLGHFCAEAGNEALLTLDEFNRGNAAAIFGDTLALLDRDKRSDPVLPDSGAFIERPFPDLPMEVPPDYSTSAGVAVGPRFRLPKTVQIIAAMNSADRSVAPLDAALRRRFAVVRVEPDYEVLADNLSVAVPPEPWVPPAGTPDEWSVEDVCGLAVALLRAINRRLEFVLGQDFLLGHSLMWSVRDDDIATTRAALQRAFARRVVPTLRAYLTDRDEALAAILGGPAAEEPVPAALAPLLSWTTPSDDLAAVGAAPRLVVSDVRSLVWSDAASAFGALAAATS